MRKLNESEEKFNQKTDKEIEELYDSYLAEARKEVAWDDIPEDADYEFYRWLSFEQQHLMGQYYSKVWSHAGQETNKLISSMRSFRVISCFCMIMAVVFAVILSIISRYYVKFAFIYLILYTCFFAMGRALDIQVDRRDNVLRTAARYQAMCELLERQLEMR